MTTVVTRGAASAQALGYAARSTDAAFIEDVFSTYLYTGNGSTQTITNGIDLSTKGGLVWVKNRSDVKNNILADTARGANNWLSSNLTNAQATDATKISSFSSSGFNIGSDSTVNLSTQNYASWTFRKQAKFFDVVTYTGNGTAGRTVSHSLGSVPGCIIVKRTDTSADWQVYHRTVGNDGKTLSLQLNSSALPTQSVTYWNNTNPTSTVFSLGTNATVNANGGTYVAYLFAHNAGGFGASGTDNVISCDTYLSNTNGVDVNLGYEPQFLLIKSVDTVAANWVVVDNMRGLPVDKDAIVLQPNSSSAEAATTSPPITLTANGFRVTGTDSRFSYNDGEGSDANYLYIAIRRGPMRTPTSGTSVFTPVARNGTGTNTTITSAGFPVDLTLSRVRSGASGYSFAFFDRMRGKNIVLFSNATSAENASVTNALTGFDVMNGVSVGTDGTLICINDTDAFSTDFFRRAPGFFDVVCYTGTGSLRTVTHNLGATPELLIVKRRAGAEDWNVYSATTGNAAYLRLNTTAAVGTAGADALWGSTTPTSSVFTVKTSGGTNASGGIYVAYLFASVAGVSKVGTYTGTGTTNQINCGFTGGARFVLIKRTSSTGDWYVWDSARGIVAGNDPYLLLNSTAAEVTNTDYVDTYSAGFELSSTAPAAINANGGTFIFLAIA
jgi:hypothetical protein